VPPDDKRFPYARYRRSEAAGKLTPFHEALKLAPNVPIAERAVPGTTPSRLFLIRFLDLGFLKGDSL
jgi:hypothetical protein